MFAEFHFLRPLWLLAIIPALLLFWLLIKRRATNQQWERFLDPKLVPYLLVGKHHATGYLELALLGIMTLLIVLALAGPTFQRIPTPVYQTQSALVIALNLSYSMYADDIQPSRFERARFKIADLLNQSKDRQLALLVYAGDAFTVTPLTNDIATIKSQLSALAPDIMPSAGNNTQAALERATALLAQAGAKGHILLITDAINSADEPYLQQANNQGYPVSILAMGTAAGAPAKLKNGQFLTDQKGQILMNQLDANQLQYLATVGGGQYVTSQIGDDDIQRLKKFFSTALVTDNTTEITTNQWRELGPWLILLIIPIAALGFRRGYFGLLVAIIMIKPDPAIAIDWDLLWLNDNQQVIANYEKKDYAKVIELLAEKDDAISLYNKANALAKKGDYQQAIKHYDSALKKAPKDNQGLIDDARYNKKLVEELLAQEQSDANGQGEQGQADNTSQKQTEAANQSPENQAESPSGESDPEGKSTDQADKAPAPLAENSQAAQIEEAPLPLNEEQQATEQWLRRIKDDPGALLRRKFSYQYQQRLKDQ